MSALTLKIETLMRAQVQVSFTAPSLSTYDRCEIMLGPRECNVDDKLVVAMDEINFEQTLLEYFYLSITALVERWRPESHIFHFLVGECTITLEDVTLQHGIRVGGRPITGATYYDWEDMCQ
ncbi:hypothetical protein JHK85_053600 [Glycine max]|nr:hypothetical protein JHK86_052747 [Glycine max]KAG4927114.1 hypothetical protein JHK85_053600 [Glycine max]